jgi:hypothetical protein
VTEQSSFDLGPLTFDIPADCPDKAVFRKVVVEEFQWVFALDMQRAAFSKLEYDRRRETLSSSRCFFPPLAVRRWARFEQSVVDRFSDYRLDDGKSQTSAIPGWRLESVSATVNAKGQELLAVRPAKLEVNQPRTWRLDQMKVVEPRRQDYAEQSVGTSAPGGGVSDQSSFEVGPLTFGVPSSCPDKAAFEGVVREELRDHFGKDNNRAAFCKSEYDRCREVFAGFPEKFHHWRAQMRDSHAAQQWERFDDAMRDRFSDFADDGDKQTPAIPGWDMWEESLSVTVRDQSRQKDAGQGKGRGRGR